MFLPSFLALYAYVERLEVEVRDLRLILGQVQTRESKIQLIFDSMT